jgi:hypothetical protein
LAAVKLTTVQVTKLSLQLKLNKIRMICFAKPELTKDFYVHLTKPIIIIRDKPILSSERMLHKDYDRKCSVAETISGCDSQDLAPRRTDWRQIANRDVTMSLIVKLIS